MFEHLFNMVGAAFLIVLLIGFLTGGFSNSALYFLSFCGYALIAGIIAEIIRDIRNGNW